MDRAWAYIVCDHCGYERTVSFYGDDACMNVDGCQESNASREKFWLESTCEKCQVKGFHYKRDENGYIVTD